MDHTPGFKLLTELTPSDFERHPVWARESGHGNEDTYRPATAPLPIDPRRTPIVVRAQFDLSDGTRCEGFFHVPDEDWDVPPEPDLRRISQRYGAAALTAIQQPRIFVGQRQFGFWGGRKGVSPDQREALYTALGKRPDEVFPVRFSGSPQLAKGVLTGQALGFYRIVKGQPVRVEI